MRPVVSLAAAASAAALTIAAAPPTPNSAPPAQAPVAESVQSHQSPTAYVTRPQHGYSAQARRVADCLASYPGYDVKTDRIPTSSGATRRCPL